MNYEILFIVLAAFITAGLSIHSIIKNADNEKELKEKQENLLKTQKELNIKQDDIINLQNQYSKEINNKTEEIISLQNQLIENANEQLNKLKRIQNPIPDYVNLFFKAEIDLNEKDKAELKEFTKNQFIKYGTILPYKFEHNNQLIKRFDILKDIGLQLLITLESNNKKINLFFNKAPLSIFGHHGISDFEYINAQVDGDQITFNCNNLYTNDIRSDNIETSINDFKKSTAKISYRFNYPFYFLEDNKSSKNYAIGRNQLDLLLLNFKQLTLKFKSYSITIDNLVKLNKFEFQGNAILK